MPDPREAIREIVRRDMQRTLRLLPKDRTKEQGLRAWVRSAVSQEMWNLFYPILNQLTEEDPVILFVVWEWQKVDTTQHGEPPSSVERWEMIRWCGCKLEENVLIRITEWATELFGVAANVEEVVTADWVGSGQDPEAAGYVGS